MCVLREVGMHGFSTNDRRRNLGVHEAGKDVVVIGQGLAGMFTGIDH